MKINLRSLIENLMLKVLKISDKDLLKQADKTFLCTIKGAS